MQKSFIAIIPFFLLTAIVSLAYHLFIYLAIDVEYLNKESIKSFLNLLQSFTSLIAVISISYFFAQKYKISTIISIILSITIYITILYINSDNYNFINLLSMPFGFNIYVLLLPIASTYLLKILFPYLSLNINKDDGNNHIYDLFNYLIIFYISYALSIGLYLLVDYLLSITSININPITANLPDILVLAIRNILVEFFWFFGIHGEHIVNGIFGKDILFIEIFNNLTYAEFNRIFIMLGGAGVGLAILIPLIIYSKNKSIKTIVKLSIPLTIFNIDTLLIYVIVVFNRFLFLPFLLLPLLNLVLAYSFLNIFSIEFTNNYVTWTTPIFIDSYIKTNGDLDVLFLQFLILSIDIVIYTYFIKKFLNSQAIDDHKIFLKESLNIQVDLNSEKDIKSYQIQNDIIESNIKVHDLISTINEKTLLMYYQAKVDINNNTCKKFEALLRYKIDGQIKGPIFLDAIEQAGLAHIIDLWVCKKVKEDLKNWQKDDFHPLISINLNPDTIKSTQIINEIISMFKGHNIEFEIIERSFLFKNAQDNINLLIKNGFEISIDDFGTGYSSLETIAKHNIHELKLDKSLIDIIHTKKGYSICKHTTNLCHDIGAVIVAEGVETKEQLDIVKSLNIDLIQGYYFSKAISFNSVLKFKKDFEK